MHTSTRAQRRPVAARVAAWALTIVLFTGLTMPVAAFASQLDTDIICGTTVAEGSYDEADVPDIDAANAIVLGSDGTVYYERDADEQVKIASITKVMTAIVALENADLDTTVIVDADAANVGQSSIYLEEGDTLTLETALLGLLKSSGNDCAMAIASSVGALIDPESDDPYQTFIDAMNDKAAELGMENTVFTNPHGLDFDEWEGDLCSSAADVATMFAYAMENETFRELEASDTTVVTVESADGSTRWIELAERNEILGESGNIGGKTGTTDLAGNCFVGAFSEDSGGEVYVVVLGCSEEDQRWNDTLALTEWYYDHVASIPFSNTAEALADDTPVLASVSLESWTDKTVDVTLEDASQTATAFSLAGDIEQTFSLYELSGTVEAGDEVGYITYSQNGRELGSATLVAAETVEKPSFFEGIMVWFDRLVRNITGRSTTAETVVYNTVPDPAAYDAI